MSRGHLPYRGEPQPHYPKRQRQVRNLRLERSRDKLTIGISLLLSILALIGGFFVPRGNDNIALWAMFMLALIGLIFTASVADATKSVNRFRKGYDFDASILEKDEEDRKDKTEGQ